VAKNAGQRNRRIDRPKRPPTGIGDRHHVDIAVGGGLQNLSPRRRIIGLFGR